MVIDTIFQCYCMDEEYGTGNLSLSLARLHARSRALSPSVSFPLYVFAYCMCMYGMVMCGCSSAAMYRQISWTVQGHGCSKPPKHQRCQSAGCNLCQSSRCTISYSRWRKSTDCVDKRCNCLGNTTVSYLWDMWRRQTTVTSQESFSQTNLSPA
jgi:hypothetical protein